MERIKAFALGSLLTIICGTATYLVFLACGWSGRAAFSPDTSGFGKFLHLMLMVSVLAPLLWGGAILTLVCAWLAIAGMSEGDSSLQRRAQPLMPPPAVSDQPPSTPDASKPTPAGGDIDVADAAEDLIEEADYAGWDDGFNGIERAKPWPNNPALQRVYNRAWKRGRKEANAIDAELSTPRGTQDQGPQTPRQSTP